MVYLLKNGDFPWQTVKSPDGIKTWGIPHFMTISWYMWTMDPELRLFFHRPCHLPLDGGAQ